MDIVPFNSPYKTGDEIKYIEDTIKSGKVSGNGKYTQLCQDFFQNRYGILKCLLTTSCTDALEMAAILMDIQIGDEVIMPSYTFVSTANAFVLRGAKIVFVDSESNHPNMDANKIEKLITKKTKLIVVVHYAGNACDMDKVMEIADKHDLYVVEDAAQAIDGYYIDKLGNKRALGSIGHLAAFSFHETKNIISGEGGMLVINDLKFLDRAEVIWEKGTNRSAFFRGEIDKYNWVDVGSSFLPSEIIAAFLWAQLENLEVIQQRRKDLWMHYYSKLESWAQSNGIELPKVPSHSTNNAHIFYLICKDGDQRSNLLNYLNTNGIYAVFHYLSLHQSPYYLEKHDGRVLPESDRYSDCVVRLPLYHELDIEKVVHHLIHFNEMIA